MLKHGRALIVVVVVLALIVADFAGPLRVRQLSIRLAPEPVFHLGGFAVTNTLLASWLAMLLLLVAAVLARRKLADVPSSRSLQNAVEAIIETLYGFMEGIVGEKARSFFPVVATFFLFILTANWLGLLPGFGSVGFWAEEGGRRVFVPLLRGATADLSTTIALAVCAVISLQVYGVRMRGLRGYASRFLPIGRLRDFAGGLVRGKGVRLSLLFRGLLDLFIGLMELFEDLTKILSFSFRLFGNVFGAEVLLLVIAFLVPYVASIPFLILEVFGGFIQAFIFAVLTTAFLGSVTSPHGKATEAKAGAPVPAPPSAQPSTLP